MNLPRIILALLIVSCSSCSSLKGLASQSPVISNLRAGESLKLEYSSTGCFGGSRYEITFVRSGSQIQASGDRVLGYEATRRVPLTPILLSANDVQRLERLIRKYRTPEDPDVFCYSTTVSKISLTKRSAGKVIHRESYTDSAGKVLGGIGLLTIPDLASRMPEVRPGSQGRRMLRSR